MRVFRKSDEFSSWISREREDQKGYRRDLPVPLDHRFDHEVTREQYLKYTEKTDQTCAMISQLIKETPPFKATLSNNTNNMRD